MDYTDFMDWWIIHFFWVMDYDFLSLNVLFVVVFIFFISPFLNLAYVGVVVCYSFLFDAFMYAGERGNWLNS